MAEKVKLSKDGASIDFVQSDSLPTSVKKFRQSPEIEGFYRFIFENDLQKEAYDILNRIIEDRKMKKAMMKKEAKEAAKLEKAIAHQAQKKTKPAKIEVKMATPAPFKLKLADKKPAPKAKTPVAVKAKPTAKPASKTKPNVSAKSKSAAKPTVKFKSKKR
jgi:hypothetical protein